jgi:hypothetical protein
MEIMGGDVLFEIGEGRGGHEREDLGLIRVRKPLGPPQTPEKSGKPAGSFTLLAPAGVV